MKKVLIIAYYFPPVAASGAMRPLAFCRYLEGYGWQPSVLTTDSVSVYPAHPVDESLSQRIPRAVHVDRVPHGNPLRQMVGWRDRVRELIGRRSSDRRLGSSGRGDIAANGASERSESGTLTAMKHFVLDRVFAFPDPQCAWLAPAVAFAKQCEKADIPDLVYATGGPWTSLLVGKTLAEHWRVPFVADYRDPWTNNPYVSYSSPRLNGRAKSVEREVCLVASRIVANTTPLTEQLQQDYPEAATKMITITNGYDPELFPTIEGTVSEKGEMSTAGAGKGLELCHFGTVYGKRTPAVLLQVFSELYREGRIAGRQIRLRFVGAWDVEDSHCEELAQGLEKIGLLKREPPMPYDACLRQMAAADALLVIQPDSPLQIPGKIYEYIASGRPLVLVGGEGATASLVTGNRLGLACPNNGDGIRSFLVDLLEGRRTLQSPDPARVAQFSYRSLTSELAEIFNAVCVGQSVRASGSR